MSSSSFGRTGEKTAEQRMAKRPQGAADHQLKGFVLDRQLIVRSAYGLGYAGITFLALVLGTWPTVVLTCSFSALCSWEFFKLARMHGRMPNELLGVGAAVAFPIATHFSLYWIAIVFYLLIIATGIWFVVTPRANIFDVSVTIFGALYTGLLLSAIVRIRVVNPSAVGGVLTFIALASIWINDSLAYLVGTRLGKHKMAPRISPKKSWEGFIAGMLGSVAVWVLLSYTLLPMNLYLAVMTGVVAGFMGVCGDLFESRIKRGVSVKDSGNIMPGHGGMLDRSDSLLFGLAAALFVLLLGGVI